MNTEKVKIERPPLTPRHFVMGVQHVFAMFGATVLVPSIVGTNPSVALLCAGIGTLIFHLCTKGIVPVFLGSSFAFITALQAVIFTQQDIPKAQGGVIFAGLIYVVLAILVKFIGVERIKRLFPPVVTGPIIVVIGLSLAPSAITNASACWPIALIVLAVVIVFMCFVRGFFNLLPVLMGLVIGYLLCLVCDATGLSEAAGWGQMVKLQTVADSGWIISLDSFSLPVFDISSIVLIAPIAIVTFMEHIGDVVTNGAVVGKNFLENPGLHRTLLGDGLATMFAGLIGGPPNTTYGENTSVLAVTGAYDPRILRIAAVFAIIMGLIGKFGAVLQTIPTPVLGGISFILYGMIASIGLRSLVTSKTDFTQSRNLVIVAVILVTGLGLSSVSLKPLFDLFGAGDSEIANNMALSGQFVATLAGVVLNAVLPDTLFKVSKKEKKALEQNKK